MESSVFSLAALLYFGEMELRNVEKKSTHGWFVYT